MTKVSDAYLIWQKDIERVAESTLNVIELFENDGLSVDHVTGLCAYDREPAIGRALVEIVSKEGTQ